MKYVVANWKMNLGVRESVALARGVLRHLRGKDLSPEVVLCPPATALFEVHKSLARSRVKTGAQSSGPAYRGGAFTGEISPSMIEDVKAEYVLVGHSERRRNFGETEEIIMKKMQALSESSLQPILCIGETASEHEAGDSYEVITSQLENVIKYSKWPRRAKMIIAYEPIFAIGTGETPSPGYIVEMHSHIRETIIEKTSFAREDIKIIYGGSVNTDNAYQLLREPEIDGVLVGGASLKIQEFKGILDSAEEVLVAQSN